MPRVRMIHFNFRSRLCLIFVSRFLRNINLLYPSSKDINITNHIVLHVFYATLYAERLRLDVYENWLTFIGTFGGITGLHMGYSFVSGFEMIFFVFVRPACNWLTKKQIRYRIKRRQKKAKMEQEKKQKMEEEKQRQERLEAFLRMRPFCPQN